VHILSVYLVVDVVDMWPKSHFLCLFLAFCGVLGILLFDGMFENAFPIKRIAVIGAITVAACTIIYFIAPLIADIPVIPKPKVPEVEVIGTLQPGTEPIPSNDVCSMAKPDALRILIGDNTIARDIPGKFIALKIGRCDVVSMKRTSQGVSVDADLYDGDGKLIARIRNKEIKALSGEKSSVERGGDLSTLIIKDETGRETLFMRYLNTTTIRVRGIFGCPGHKTVIVKDDETVPGMFMSKSCLLNNGVAIAIQ
jgi:hypothetical protein